MQNGFVSTLAGSGIPGGVDGVGATARFQSPFGVAVNPVDGTLFVSEFNGQRIRRVERDGRVTLVAGTGVAGDADGAGHTATFRNPTGIAVAASGAIYVAERGGHRIRKVVLRSGADPRSASSYVVSTWAGAGVAGSVDAPGTSAGFNSPQGVAAGPDGTLYVADTSNNKVRLITPSREVVTIAGTGAVGAADGAGNVATFASPVGIAFVNGALAVADQTAQRVRQVRLNAEGGGSPGSAASWLVQTLAGGPGAGSSDGDGTQARFDLLHLMAADRSGNLYVADRPNQKIRRVVPATGHFPLGAPGGVAAGEVRLASPDGVIPASVLGQNLPFIQYSGSLPPGALSVARPWVFAVPEGVTAFEFTVLVEADTATWAGPPSVLNPGPAGAGSPDAQVRTLVGGATEGYLDGPAGQARLSSANDVTTDGAGNVYFTDGNSQLIRRISKAGVVSTVAGVVLEPGSTDGIGTVARFTLPHGIAATRDGRTLYVTEFRRNSVRRIALTGTDPTNPAHWTVSTIAGSATEGAVDGPGTTATFSAPRGVAVDAAGSVYVTERTGNRVRLLLFVGGDPAQAANWRVRLVAGDNGAARGGVGTTDARGASARFDAPWAIAVGTGGVVYVADANNNRIRRIADPTTFGGGLVETFAGSARGYADGAGTAAMFSFPEGVAVDAAGFLYVADLSTRRVRRITPGGLVTTVAGSGVRGSTDGPGSVATFQAPSSVAVDSMGSLYVADITRIRLIQRVVGVGTQ